MMMQTVVTVTGIRPDFIRMCNIFRLLDQRFRHILVHTGQHYDALLSDVFFQELEIRKPDYILEAGKSSSTQYEQLSYLATALPKLFETEEIYPDVVLFLGDANSVAAALPLKKEGYRIGHIEAGMRSGDRRMLEEINRTVCDVCSDILFVYHPDYAEHLYRENITKNVHVVGNTIVEVAREYIPRIATVPKRNDMILVDIHRPENFRFPDRLLGIIKWASFVGKRYALPVKMLYFKRTVDAMKTANIDPGAYGIQTISLMPYFAYLTTVYHSRFLISDSGTAQEEPALLGTQVVVPREYTERPQSVDSECSVMLTNFNPECEASNEIYAWIDRGYNGTTEWMGDGNTSNTIVTILADWLETLRSK